MDKLLIHASWGDRAETAAQIVDRWSALLDALRATGDPRLQRWVLGMPDEEQDDLADAEVLRSTVENRVEDSDISVRLECWNGLSDQGVEMTGGVGTHRDNPRLGNTFNVQFNPDEDVDPDDSARVARGLASIPLLTEITRAVAITWEADSVFAGTYELHDAQTPPKRTPWIGYITYLSPTRATRLPTDLPLERLPTPDGGTLLIAAHNGQLLDDTTIVDLAHRLQQTTALEPRPVGRPRL